METSKFSLDILANSSITLSEETDINVAKKQKAPTLAINLPQPDAFDLGETKAIPFTFSGNPTKFELLETPYGWTVSLLKLNEYGGTLAITASNFSLDPQSKLELAISGSKAYAKCSITLSLNMCTIPVGTACYQNGNPVGVVFRPKTKHQKGLVVHKKHTSTAWGCPKSHTYAIDRDNGQNNAACIEAIDATFEEFPSFSWCRGHGHDWYMPSLHELVYLFYCRAEVNSSMYEISGMPLATDGAAYWASNEVNDCFAWSLYFQDGHLNYHKKEYTKLVRAIRAF
jgi:hypothetical protein